MMKSKWIKQTLKLQKVLYITGFKYWHIYNNAVCMTFLKVMEFAKNYGHFPISTFYQLTQPFI